MIFGKKLDAIFFYLPITLLVILVIHFLSAYFLDFPFFNNKNDILNIILADYLFFNTIHVPLTFVILFTVPEFKIWAKTTTSTGPFSFWGNCIIVYILSTSIIYLEGGLIPSQASSSFFFINAFFFKNLMSAYHGIGQTLGISSLINQKYSIHLNEREKKKILKLKKLEEYLGIFLVWFMVLLTLFIYISNRNIPKKMITSFILFLILIGSAQVALSFLYPKSIRFIKFKFSLRYLMFPLQYTSWVALTFKKMIHGLENIFIIYKINNNSSLTTRKTFLVISVVVLLIWIPIGISRNFNLNVSNSTSRLLFSILWGIDITHYWADRIIYRMRDEHTRKNHGHLILD